jgi:polysaccharide biosynthesis/export protein
VTLALASCAGAGQYVSFKDLPPTEWNELNGSYLIGVGDVVSIRVYEQEALSGTVKIRSDGRMALPLVGELVAAGKAPLDLAKEIEVRLKEFIVSPRVTVNVDTALPVVVTAIGEVTKVGPITLDARHGLIQALADAGGPNDYADKSRIFVLRQFPKFQRIRFDYDAVLRNEHGAATFPLRAGDVIVVE